MANVVEIRSFESFKFVFNLFEVFSRVPFWHNLIIFLPPRDSPP